MKIYVGNISTEATDEDLTSLFGNYGEAFGRIIRDRATGVSRGFGYVEMVDGLAALAAIRELNGTELRGKALVVSEAPRDSGTVGFAVPRATPAEPGALASLLERGGPNDATTITLSDGTTTLGRALESDLVVEEPGVSREHASIRREAGAYWIRDLDSRNGTFVNGVNIGATPHRLQDSDRIELGGANTPVHWVFVQQ